jgi:hypothetical protein
VSGEKIKRQERRKQTTGKENKKIKVGKKE